LLLKAADEMARIAEEEVCKDDCMTSHTRTKLYATEEADNLLGKLNTRISQTIQSPSADEIHDLRVAVRRFKRVLVVLKPCFAREESRKLRRALKRIMENAGKVRDQDIAMHLLAKFSVSPPDALLPETQQWRDDAAQELARTLRDWVRRNVPADWRKAQEAGTARKEDRQFCTASIHETATRALPRIVAEFFRRGREAADDGASPHVIHRFRIAAKNLRYTLDFFAPLYGDSLAGLSDQLKQVQDLLGDINDAATVRLMLAGKADKKTLSALNKRQHKKTEEFRQHYAPLFSDARIRRHWKNIVRNSGTAVPATKSPGHPDKAHRGKAGHQATDKLRPV
jgi:CHAD domain-containing protein